MSRLAELSYFFPAHNEAANLRGLVEEALATLPGLADRFEIIIVNDGSRDDTPRIADELAAAHPEVRAVHHPTNHGYGAALRSGFAAARFGHLAFTDGDRQFKVADLGRLIDRMAAGMPDVVVGYRIKRADPFVRTLYARIYRFAAARYGHLAFTDGDRQFKVADLGRLIDRMAAGTPDVVVGYRIKRADPFVRTLYARIYRFANRVWFGLRVRDVDCAMKLFTRASLEGVNVESGGAFFSAELLIKLKARGRRIDEVGVPHYPRTAGSPTGAKPSVVFRAVKDFWSLRLRLWAAPRKALARGTPILGRAGEA